MGDQRESDGSSERCSAGAERRVAERVVALHTKTPFVVLGRWFYVAVVELARFGARASAACAALRFAAASIERMKNGYSGTLIEQRDHRVHDRRGIAAHDGPEAVDDRDDREPLVRPERCGRQVPVGDDFHDRNRRIDIRHDHEDHGEIDERAELPRQASTTWSRTARSS